MDEWQDQFDEALESTLTRYGQAPEIEGLERRVLERVAERTGRMTRIRSLTVAVCPTTAALCWLVWWQQIPNTAVRVSPAKTVVPAVVKSETSNLQIATRDHEIVPASAAKTRRTPKRSAEPKLPQFPTPTPASSEERALLRLVMRETTDVSRKFSSVGGPIEPVQITAVEIKPL